MTPLQVLVLACACLVASGHQAGVHPRSLLQSTANADAAALAAGGPGGNASASASSQAVATSGGTAPPAQRECRGQPSVSASAPLPAASTQLQRAWGRQGSGTKFIRGHASAPPTACWAQASGGEYCRQGWAFLPRLADCSPSGPPPAPALLQSSAWHMRTQITTEKPCPRSSGSPTSARAAPHVSPPLGAEQGDVLHTVGGVLPKRFH